MKRILTLLLGVAFVLGAAVQASALEVQVSGEMATVFGFNDNPGFSDDDENDHFFARQRYRIAAEFIASENLRGVLQFQFGTTEWGDAGSGGQLDTNSSSATTRRAYIDWNVADTTLNFKIGLQYIALPSAVFGNPFFGANAAGVIGSLGLNDNVTLSAIWARPWQHDNDDKKYNETDMFALVADFNYDNLSISPWAVYANIGSDSGFWESDYTTFDRDPLSGGLDFDKNSDLFGGGLALTVSPVDDLEIKFDGMYVKLDNDGRKNGVDAPEGDGWLVALAVDYGLEWGTPGIFGWYASGDSKSDSEKNKFGRMPIIGGDDGFAATPLAFPGAFSCGEDTWVSTSGVGTWGLGLQLADISFVEDLSHLVRVAYFQGTNDKDAFPAVDIGEGVYMTKKDWALEVDLDSEYKIMENFSAVFELSYIRMDIDKKSYAYRNGQEDKNAYNAQVTFMYEF